MDVELSQKPLQQSAGEVGVVGAGDGGGRGGLLLLVLDLVVLGHDLLGGPHDHLGVLFFLLGRRFRGRGQLGRGLKMEGDGAV